MQGVGYNCAAWENTRCSCVTFWPIRKLSFWLKFDVEKSRVTLGNRRKKKKIQKWEIFCVIRGIIMLKFEHENESMFQLLDMRNHKNIIFAKEFDWKKIANIALFAEFRNEKSINYFFRYDLCTSAFQKSFNICSHSDWRNWNIIWIWMKIQLTY